MEFSYKLVPRLYTPSIDPGGTIEIGIFITGNNDDQETAINAKIYFNYSSKYLINPKNAGQITANLDSETRDDGLVYPLMAPEHTTKFDLNPDGSVAIGISSIFFVRLPEARQQGKASSPIMGESVIGPDRTPPLDCKINISSKVPPGNYDVDMILTYTNGSLIKTDDAKITVHVKNKMERYGWKFALAGAIVGLASLIISAIP